MMRRSIVIGCISSILTISGCVTPPPKQTGGTVGAVTARPPTEEEDRQAIITNRKKWTPEQLAEQQKNVEAWRARRKQTQPAPSGLDTWIQTNRGYLLKLCFNPPGDDHADAWTSFNIAVSSDTQRASEAQAAGKHVIDCDKLRDDAAPNPQTHHTDEHATVPVIRWGGYTWSNRRRAHAASTVLPPLEVHA